MRKNKFILLLLLVFSFLAGVVAFNGYQVNAASSYYSSISSSAYGTSLKSSLRTLISKQTKVSTYDDCKDPAILKKTDGNASGTKIILFWSGQEVTSWDGGTTWNREHVWPQSLSGGLYGTSGAGADLHHIRPVDSSINSSHNNNPYGVVSGGKYVTTKGGATTQNKLGGGIFEPADNRKGDTARIIFYMIVRYSSLDGLQGNVCTSMDLLLEWNDLDPVDSYETRRNEAVYGIQGNRNPFIDNPDYADYIWGGVKPGESTGSGSGTGSGSTDTGSGSTDTGSGSTGTTPTVPSTGKVATFEFGANSSSSDTDSSSAMSTYTETSGNYTLTLSNLSKVYTSCDASGNSCLKLGTSSVVGSFNFNVPDAIDQIIILVTGYKSNTAVINVNGSTQTISTYSANSEYTNVTVDTSNSKTVSFATTSSGYRCKINTIVFYDLDSSGSGSGSGSESGGEIDTPVTDVSSALSTFQSYSTKASLKLDYDYNTYSYSVPGTYSYTFTSKVWSSATATTLNGVKWDPETTSMTSANKYYGYESARGQQFGSSSAPFEEVIIKTVDNILDGVTKVTIQASGASGTDATVSAYVGTSKIGTTKSLTSSNETYTFTSSTGMRGNVKFVIKQTTSKAIYVKGMSMTYSGSTATTESYSLNSAGIRFGSYITKDMYNILTAGGAKFGVEYVAGNVSDWSTVSPKTMYCTPAQVASPNATTTSSTGNYYQWSLMINNLNYNHIDKYVSGRAFVEYEGVRYYMSSASYSLRTLANSYLSSSELSSHTGILNHLKNY